MGFTKNIGMLLLSIYLIVVGFTVLVTGLAIPPVLIGALAIASGVFLLIGK